MQPADPKDQTAPSVEPTVVHATTDRPSSLKSIEPEIVEPSAPDASATDSTGTTHAGDVSQQEPIAPKGVNQTGEIAEAIPTSSIDTTNTTAREESKSATTDTEAASNVGREPTQPVASVKLSHADSDHDSQAPAAPINGTTSINETAPINANTGMEIDTSSSNGDTDSTYEDAESSTASLRESVYAYIEENGRSYHAFNSGKYNLPCDASEQDRLDLQHHLFMLTFDGALHIAPLPEALHNVLDVGTGTGLWAMEFEKYPQARVVGTDLSPMQPTYVPPNCSFEVNDAEEPWDYHIKFDYIHGRALLSAFRDDFAIVRSAFAALRPGGVFELQDPQMPITCIDDTMHGTALQEWATIIPIGAAKTGRPVTNSRNYPRYMAEAGFVDIVEKHYYWPLNTWPKGQKEKLIGMWARQNLLDGINGMSMAMLTRGLNWSREKVEVFLANVRRDIMNRNIHAYVDVIVVYGTKPAV